MRCRRVYFSNDGTQPVIYGNWIVCSSKVIKNGSKTLSLKLGYHARWEVQYE